MAQHFEVAIASEKAISGSSSSFSPAQNASVHPENLKEPVAPAAVLSTIEEELVPILGSPALPFHIQVQNDRASVSFRQWRKVQVVSSAIFTIVIIIFLIISLKNAPKEPNFEPIENSNVRFSDVYGCEGIKSEVARMVDFLKNPERLAKFGATIPRGYLLAGPPGVGKTYLAKAIAGEANVPLFAVSGAEFDEVFVGLGAARVRKLFATARARGRAIIFIDEIDAVAGKRSQQIGSNVGHQTLNQLLVEMDGFGSAEGIIVLGATNMPSQIDEALLRPGRIDSILNLELPDLKGRAAMLGALFGEVPEGSIDQKIDVQGLAEQTQGLSGAELTNLVNHAKLIASSDPSSTILTSRHMEESLLFVKFGPICDHPYSQEDQTRIAHHEAGHALAAYLTPFARTPIMASIISRSQASGFVYFPGSKSCSSQGAFEAEIRVLLAGYLAEVELYGEKGAGIGASSDFDHANAIARGMVNAGFGSRTKFFKATSPNEPLSEATRSDFEHDVKDILNDAAKDVKAMLKKHRTAWEALATALFQSKSMNHEEMVKVLINNGASEALSSAIKTLTLKKKSRFE